MKEYVFACRLPQEFTHHYKCENEEYPDVNKLREDAAHELYDFLRDQLTYTINFNIEQKG